ncbi:hypothetical protein CYMTET_41326, partial [Cymbomonas tetramitiformis]
MTTKSPDEVKRAIPLSATQSSNILHKRAHETRKSVADSVTPVERRAQAGIRTSTVHPILVQLMQAKLRQHNDLLEEQEARALRAADAAQPQAWPSEAQEATGDVQQSAARQQQTASHGGATGTTSSGVTRSPGGRRPQSAPRAAARAAAPPKQVSPKQRMSPPKSDSPKRPKSAPKRRSVTFEEHVPEAETRSSTTGPRPRPGSTHIVNPHVTGASSRKSIPSPPAAHRRDPGTAAVAPPSPKPGRQKSPSAGAPWRGHPPGPPADHSPPSAAHTAERAMHRTADSACQKLQDEHMDRLFNGTLSPWVRARMQHLLLVECGALPGLRAVAYHPCCSLSPALSIPELPLPEGNSSACYFRASFLFRNAITRPATF